MSTALYRRYRPETFADVIGQEHVTDPLMAALRADRITHAYLFSGPRGCGKTTSARIFARCLNCAEGPTDTPCGTCPSCVELARDGAGSLDVVEMDAASHGGVDDARELRERAAFAPARDRYKIFIIDEAHMVTSQGFNALLKLVEEPPAHVKFVFATTEPEKVIGTIRSRTHHYPFRLVPPERLQGYLEELCAAEGVQVASGVLPLVVRAGGGSVRDSLSVLDQLIAGAQDGEVSYERAVALLGYTHATLLDDVVDALAARDGASLFRVVDRVIDSGHDPRRFAEDVLERLRDLVIIAVSGDQASSVLRALPRDQFERMQVQSRQLGPAELSRAGDLVNDALTEMSGATSPRLQLELLCARLLLPGADDAARGYATRLERIERHLASGVPAGGSAPTAAGQVPAPQSAPDPVARTAGGPVRAEQPASEPVAPTAAGQVPAQQPASEPVATVEPPGRAEPVAPARSGAGSAETASPGPAATATGPAEPGSPGAAEPTSPAAEPTAPTSTGREPTEDSAPEPADIVAPPTTQQPAAEPAGGGAADWPASPQPVGAEPTAPDTAARPAPTAATSTPPADAPAPAAPPAPASGDVELVRRRWPEVLATLARFKRSTWALVSQNAQVADLSGGVLQLAFATSGLAHTFRSGAHTEPLQQALVETLGVQVRIEPVLSQAAEGGAGSSASAGGATGAWAAAAPAPTEQVSSAWARAETPAEPSPPSPAGPPPEARATAAGPAPEAGPPTGDAPSAPPVAPSPHSAPSPPTAQPIATVPLSEDTPSPDDPDAEHSGLIGAPLIEQMLGGTVISEDSTDPYS